jgi:hypothetical protein
VQVQFLRHSQIDKQRWLQSIRQSSNGLIYAWPQYLDAVSPNWQALVNEDYSLVMPLTNRSKWGIHYLYQPAFCQQLGVFGNGVNESTIQAFLAAAKKHFTFAEIHLNHQNSFSSDYLYTRKNYLLLLTDDYGVIRSNYSKDLIKKNLQRTEKFRLQYRSSDNILPAIQAFQDLYADRMKGTSQNDFTTLTQACLQLQKTNNVFVREVRMPNEDLLACGVFLKDERRIYNIASTTLPNGRTLEANHFLFDKLIQEFAGSGLLLDFEGSEVAGIERFYKKFGAINQPYFTLRWNHLPWPIRLLKK